MESGDPALGGGGTTSASMDPVQFQCWGMQVGGGDGSRGERGERLSRSS